jgi:type I restriction enzyme M protein
MRPDQAELLDRVFRDPATKQGLKFFVNRERAKIKLRLASDDRIEIYCFKRERWIRAKPEEVVRQMFLVWVQDSLKYPLSRIDVEWPIQMGQDAERERADIIVFTDDALTDPFIAVRVEKAEQH